MQKASRVAWIGIAAVALCGLLASPASAQGTTAASGGSDHWTMGVRGGGGTNPTQAIVGINWESPGLTQTGHLVFRPHVDIGVINGIGVSGSLEVLYLARIPKSSLSIYFGGSTAAGLFHTSGTCTNVPNGTGGTTPVCGGSFNTTGGGHSMVIGFETGRLYFELRAGSGVIHSMEAVAGYVIKR